MIAADDSRLGELAVTEGLITPRQLQDALRESEEAGTRGESVRVSQVLTRHGWLTATQLAQLLQKLADRVVPSDRYEVLEELGHGGMAVVYRARDRKLGREVALKILRRECAGSPGVVKRMLREARIIASLDHPGIVRLHDISESETEPYLVMELLQGRTLDALLAARTAPLDALLLIVERAARAVHAAHASGVVHRDLKPGNIMIEEATGGRVVVLDFGLAQLATEAGQLTRSGAVLGTPYYMAPEQVQADHDRIGPKTDVYALGVILYEILTGHPPYEGSLAEIYHKILTDSAPSPRRNRSSLSSSLETICIRAMARDPRDRYPTAEALANDLARFRAGESILARPFSPLTLLVRRLGRRKGAATATAAGLLLLATAGVLTWALRRTEGAVTVQQGSLLEQMELTSDTCMRAAIDLRRVGNVAGMKKHAAALEEVCRRVIAAEPRLAEPHYLCGRMYRAQMRFDDALAEQERALAKEAVHRGARYERGLLRIRDYDARIEGLQEEWHRRQAERIKGESGQAAASAPPRLKLEDETARTMRASAARDLQDLPHPVARGLCLWLEGRSDEATATFQKAVEETPDVEEAYEWLARIAREEKKLLEAESWYSRGLERDRGYVAYLEGRAQARIEEGERGLTRGEDVAELLRGAADSLDTAIRITPENDRLPWRRAYARYHLGKHLESRGQPAAAIFEQGIQDCDAALQLNPRRAENHMRRGLLRLARGTTGQATGQPFEDWYRAAISDFDEAIRLSPSSYESHLHRADTRSNLAVHEYSHGRDSAGLFRTALEDYDRVIQLNPGWEDGWHSRAAHRTNYGVTLLMRGQPSTGEFDAALADYDEALRLNPEGYGHWLGRAQVHLNRAYSNPSPFSLFKAASEDMDRALEINPCSYKAWNARGILYSNWGYQAMRHKGDPYEIFQNSVDAFDRALALKPDSDEILMRRAKVRANWADARRLRKQDPLELFRAALADLDEAIKRNATRDESWHTRAYLRGRTAIFVPPAEAAPLLKASMADFDEALKLNPGNAQTYVLRGSVLAAHKQDEAALRDYDHALRLNPALEAQLKPEIERSRQRLQKP